MRPEDIIDFWFVECDPKDWWSASPGLDRAIADRFGEIHARVALGEGFGWRVTPEGRLAEIIVLDQFSRQLYRGDRRAFAQDGMALALAQEAVAGGHHLALEGPRRLFLLMPYMHSESMLVQEIGQNLFAAVNKEEGVEKAGSQHIEVLRRFGRFPKRNAALGRASTPEELAYMAETAGKMV